MMSQSSHCPLCLNDFIVQKSLCDENGCRNLEIFTTMNRFFQPKFLNKLTDLCLTCWNRISGFYSFQEHCFIENDMTIAASPFLAQKASTFNGAYIENEALEDEHDEDVLLDKAELGQEECFSELPIKDEITVEETELSLADYSNKCKNATKTRNQLEYDKIISQWQSSLECGICKELYPNFSHLCRHFQLQHPQEKPHILCCKRKRTSQREIAQHASFHLDAYTFQCPHCDKCLESKVYLRQHIHRAHRDSGTIYLCNICEKEFWSVTRFNEHMVCHRDIELYKCLACSETFRQRTKLILHLEQQHSKLWSEKKNTPNIYATMLIDAEQQYSDIISRWKTSLECGICNASHSNYSALAQHFHFEHPQEDAHILCCDSKLKTRWEIVEHARLHMDPCVYQCQMCDKCHTNLKELFDHQRKMHVEIPKHKCSVCNRICTSSKILKEHMASHAGVDLYKCLSCPLTFRYRNKLNLHMENLHPQIWSKRADIKNFVEITELDEEEKRIILDIDICQSKLNLKCSICNGDALENIAVLWQHFHLKHPQAEPHIVCCERTLYTRADIAKHVSTNLHKNSNAFNCLQCGESQATVNLLEQHMLENHSKRYKCNLCTKSFGYLRRLEEHMSMHTNSHLYKCLECPKKFRYYEKLTDHLKSVHAELWSQRKSIPNFRQSIKNVANIESQNKLNEIGKMDDLEKNNTNADTKNDDNARSRATKKIAVSNYNDQIAQWKSSLECGICLEPFGNFAGVQQHFRLEHVNEKAYILCCNRKLLTRWEILEHINFHNDPKRFQCQQCGHCFAAKKLLQLHVYRKHNIASAEKYKCCFCNKHLQSSQHLREHIATHTGAYLYKCVACPQTFRYRKSLNAHLRKLHAHLVPKKKDIPMFLQLTELDAENELAIDETISQWKPTLECPLCHVSRANIDVLWQHFQIKHPNVQPHIICCERKLSTRSEIAEHASFHIVPVIFKCQQCKEWHASREELQQHMQSTHVQKYKCSLCDHSFSVSRLLKEHMTTHTNCKLYVCQHCSQTFRDRARLNQHKQDIHPESSREISNLDTDKCSKPKTNTEIANLDTAPTKIFTIKMYDDKRRWHHTLDCPICTEEKLFATWPKLEAHFSEHHSTEVCYTLCCNQSFYQKESLLPHARLHVDPDYYSCKICNRCFTGTRPLNHHYREVHYTNVDNKKIEIV